MKLVIIQWHAMDSPKLADQDGKQLLLQHPSGLIRACIYNLHDQLFYMTINTGEGQMTVQYKSTDFTCWLPTHNLLPKS